MDLPKLPPGQSVSALHAEIILLSWPSSSLCLSLSLQGGQTALMLAVRHGRGLMVRLLLRCGADTNIQDCQGTTALVYACERGHTHIARLLLQRAECDTSVTDRVSAGWIHYRTQTQSPTP